VKELCYRNKYQVGGIAAIWSSILAFFRLYKY